MNARTRLTRRNLLQLAAASAAAVSLGAACGQTAPTAVPTPAPAAPRPAAPAPTTAPAAAATKLAAPAPTTAPAAAATKPAAAAATTAPKPEAKPAGSARGGVPANSGAKGAVKFLHVWGASRLPLMEQQIKDFQGLWPDIKIEGELISQDGMNEKYLTSIAGGSPPDTIMLNHDQVPAFGGRGAVTPLDPMLQKDGLNPADIFYETDWKLAQFKGKYMSMPQATSGGWYMLLWNKDLFKKFGLDPEKPPKSWDELEQVSKQLTKLEGGKATTLGFDPTWHPNYPMFKEWLFCNGGQLLSDDSKKVIFDSQEGLDTAQWLLDFNERINGGYSTVQALKAEMGSIRDAWYNGRSVLHVEGVWIFREAKAAKPDLNFGAAPMPFNAKNPKAKSTDVADTGWGYAIPKGAKNPDAAWEWTKYITAGEGNHNFFKAQLRPSPVKKYNEDPYFAQNNPHWAVAQSILKDSTSYTLTGIQAQMNKAIADMQEEVLLKKKPPAQAVKDATAATQKLLDEWNAKQG